MVDKILRIGAIGAGRVFREAHLPVYAQLEGVRLAAIYDPDPAAAKLAQERYQHLPGQTNEAVICQTAEELYGLVDVVDICSTVRWHAFYAVQALEHNLHVMSEKPMARTWWEAQRVAQASAKSQGFFQLNDDNIFIPRYQALRHVIESGMIGEVQHIWIARGYPSSGRKGWFWQPLEAGGGCILDYGSHAVASTWFLVGLERYPTEVRSLGIQVKNRTRLIDGRLQAIEIDDDAHFKIRFVDPKTHDWVTVVVEATWTWPELGENGSDVRGYIEVEGSLGSVTGYVDELDQDFLRVRLRGFGERLLPVPAAETEEESMRTEITNFIQCIREGKASLLNADLAAGVIQVINCAQLSELRGRVSITPAELMEFSQQVAYGIANPQQAGDQIALALNAPHRLS